MTEPNNEKNISYTQYIEALDNLDIKDQTYEREWANAIDQTLADAVLEAFCDCIKAKTAEVINKPEPNDRDLKWLSAQMSKKIDILNKIIHMQKTTEDDKDE